MSSSNEKKEFGMQLLGEFQRCFRMVLLLGVAWALGAVSKCCSQMPAARLIGIEPEYNWAARYVSSSSQSELQSDPTLFYDEVVSGGGPFQEYSFKLTQAEASACADPDGYSEWIPRAQRLALDLSQQPNGVQRLCLVARGTNSCDELKQLPYHQAAVYHWILNAPLGSWSLLSPTGVIDTLSTTATWSSSERAQHYHIFAASSNKCDDIVVDFGEHPSTQASITLPQEGSYYLCGVASDSVGNVKSASNNGIPFKIFSGTEPRTLRDSLLSEDGVSSGHLSVGVHRDEGQAPWYQLPLISVASPDKVLLTQWTAHMDGARPTPTGFECQPVLEGFAQRLQVWSSFEAVTANPESGDVASFDLSQYEVQERTVTAGISITGCPIERLSFDLSYAGTVLEPEQQYVIGFEFASLSGIAGVWGVMESAQEGDPDILLYDQLDGTVTQEPISSFEESVSGRLSVKIVGQTVP